MAKTQKKISKKKQLERDTYLADARARRAERDKLIRKAFSDDKLDLDSIERGLLAASQELDFDAILKDEKMAKHLIEFGVGMLMLVRHGAPWDSSKEAISASEAEAREHIFSEESYEVLGKDTVRSIQFYLNFYRRIALYALPVLNDPVLVEDENHRGPYREFQRAFSS